MAIDMIKGKSGKSGILDMINPAVKNPGEEKKISSAEIGGKRDSGQSYALPKSIKNALLGVDGKTKTGIGGININEGDLAKLTPSENKAIEKFIEEDKGTNESKLEAVRAAVKKGVPINRENLQSIQNAFSLGKSLGESGGDVNSSEALLTEAILSGADNGRILSSKVGEVAQLQAALKALGMDISKSSGNLTIVTMDGVDYAIDLKSLAQAGKILLEQGENKDASIKSIKDLFMQRGVNIKGDVQEVNAADAGELQRLEEMEQFLDECINRLSAGVDGVAASILNGSQFRQVVRVEITVSMSIAVEEFNVLRSGINNRWEKIEASKSSQSVQITVSAMIDEMDSFIMKSDALLYTGMKTEKQLLSVSSSLQNARAELENGNMALAKEIAKSAVKILSEINFTPSHRRAELHVNSAYQRFVTGESLYGAKNQLNTLSHLRYEEKSSSRIMLELMRSIGLNNESEVSELFERFGDKAEVKEKLGKDFVNDNVKAILMKLMTKENDEKAGSSIQKLSDAVFGMQLMNRQESSRSEQTMMFIIPMPQVQTDARVIINGRRRVNGIDDGNCSLYFSFETVKLGFTGIKADINANKLSITVFNDDKSSVAMLEEAFNAVDEKFPEWGFSQTSIRVTGFTNTHEKDSEFEESPVATSSSNNSTIMQGEFDYKL